MKNQTSIAVLALLVTTLISGCEVIGGIFEAGVGVGVFIVIFIIGLIIFLITRMGKK